MNENSIQILSIFPKKMYVMMYIRNNDISMTPYGRMISMEPWLDRNSPWTSNQVGSRKPFFKGKVA